MEKVLEKSVKKYVLATIDEGYCWYLKMDRKNVPNQIVAHVEYSFTDDIEKCAKFAGKGIAKTILEDYSRLSNDKADLVIIPLITEYYLVKEIE